MGQRDRRSTLSKENDGRIEGRTFVFFLKRPGNQRLKTDSLYLEEEGDCTWPLSGKPEAVAKKAFDLGCVSDTSKMNLKYTKLTDKMCQAPSFKI